jgi:hypothetical protein
MKKTLTSTLLGLALVLSFGAFQPAHAEFFPDYRVDNAAVQTQRPAEPAVDAQQQQQNGSDDAHVSAAPAQHRQDSHVSAPGYGPDGNFTAPVNLDGYNPMR